jgi:hypothetical protein
MIPKDASVAVSEAEMPHVSRMVMRTLRDSYDADYILYGIHSGGGGAHNAQRALASGEFEKIAERPGLALLKRKPKGAPPPPPAPAQAPSPPTGPPPPPVGPFPAPGAPPRIPLGPPGPGRPPTPGTGKPYGTPTWKAPSRAPGAAGAAGAATGR